MLLIVSAVLLTAGTGIAAHSWLNSQRAPAPVAGPSQAAPVYTEVLVAKAAIPTGTFVKDEHFRWQVWPDDNLPENYLVKGAFDETTLVGSVVRRGIASGEPITASRLIKPGDRGFLSAVLRPGYRAITTRVDAASAIAGLVFPGDLVDIVLTHAVTIKGGGDSVERHASETVLTQVRVLAIDQNVDDQGDQPKVGKTATFELTPKQVEVLTVAREIGSLSLSLRSLAKNEEELQRILESGEPLAYPEPKPGRTYTWDNEASRLVTIGSGRAAEDVVQVGRGNAVQEMHFKKGK
ncbi:MAG: Flp pilus assembly protein CpaB [Kiloniellales bacterium]